MVTNYLATCLQPALKDKIDVRSSRELRTLAEGVDAVLSGDLCAAAEVLIQRFKAVETRCTKGSWELAQHMELIPPNEVSCVGGKELEMAMQTELMEQKLRRNRNPDGKGGDRR